MNARTDTERILDAFLAPEADRLADRVIDAALADIARSPQRRALRVPWRFPTMPAISRATGIAAVALVAVVGAGGLLFLNSKGPGGPGGSPTPTAVSSPTSRPPSQAPASTRTNTTRKTRAISCCGSRRSRASQPGIRASVPAVPAGTSSVRRWRCGCSTAPRSTFMPAASI